MVGHRHLGLLLALLAWPASVRAGDAAIAVDASVTLRLTAGKTTYAVGELIPVEIELRGRADADYYFSLSGGRPLSGSEETFLVSPSEGWENPFAALLSVSGIVGSILSSPQALDGRPFVVHSLLNDFVRFRQPGTYRVIVESRRLRRYSGRPAPPLASEPTTLHIVAADPTWAAAELASATATLDGEDVTVRGHALDTLRHLGTREAALALVARYGAAGADGALYLSAALAASPYRAAIIEAMERRVDAGEPLPPEFLHDLATLRTLDEAPRADVVATMNRAQCEATRRWVAALRREPSAAALRILLESLESPPPEGCHTGLAETLARHPSEALAAFLSLPPQLASLLLEWRWDAVGGSWIRPALEEIHAKWHGDGRVAGPGDLALRRLADIDPARASALAVEEIRSGAHGTTADALLAVVPEPLPGLDGALRQRYAADRSDDRRAATMWLVSRHGSATLVPFVRDRLALGVPCSEEAAAIVYLLKHDPASGQRRLQPQWPRPRGACVVVPWTELAPHAWDEGLESAAIAHVERGDARQVRDAAHVLAARGSARAREALVARVERWSEDWRGREEEVEAAGTGPGAYESAARLDRVLVAAAFEARSFPLRPEDVERIRAACLTDDCREDVEARVRRR